MFSVNHTIANSSRQMRYPEKCFYFTAKTHTVNVLKIQTLYFILFFLPNLSLHLFLVILCGMANSVDPDQTAPSGAVWSGSTLFAYAIFSEHSSMRLKDMYCTFEYSLDYYCWTIDSYGLPGNCNEYPESMFSQRNTKVSTLLGKYFSYFSRITYVVGTH